ncbi:MAG: copper chaperone PCu(A)C [Piscinibacter sp.]|uniref:copper chaperone PCu(A)C n=1 Tax=Piscinibacter TaxID=1114981 RepID=UPI000FDDD791|nr:MULTISPECIES: copper chaperone PCu(A)C [Piscinibacter]MCW5665554.1 copper chaperone PCu(A)C [Piscinibacter sp.]
MRSSTLLLALLLAGPAQAQTRVSDAWVRATVAQQLGTGAFMRITSAQGGRLVAVQSPVARIAEVHEMTMQGDVMAMRAIESLELPPGKPVVLRPGGHHLMLMGLKQQLKAGDTVPLTLVVEGREGRRETLEVKAVVLPLGADAPKR